MQHGKENQARNAQIDQGTEVSSIGSQSQRTAHPLIRIVAEPFGPANSRKTPVAKKSKLTAAKPINVRKSPRLASNHNELRVR
jgi:hypothetical protein